MLRDCLNPYYQTRSPEITRTGDVFAGEASAMSPLLLRQHRIAGRVRQQQLAALDHLPTDSVRQLGTSSVNLEAARRKN